ncbi:hypothetical protein NDU88_002081 [Pleurodeles waltl]|uniref:Uncharacterized protein n=1 Tax=Pleurodeles waltl TaxID=8319 RepID=A0AAV7W1D1_PLEWA|nr:hypothetical protein NDU88_002081 [Pleurodeles waltl]
MKTPLVVDRAASTENIRTYIQNSGQMICYQANLVVLKPGPESKSFSGKKVADRSPKLKIHRSVSGDHDRILEIPFVLKPLPADAPLKSPHVPACMSDQQYARSKQTEQTKDLEDWNYRSISKHRNQRLNVLNPLGRRKGPIQCCV